MANEFELSFQGDASLYVIIRRSEDAKVYDGSTFSTWNDAHLSNYAINLLNRAGDVYQADFPATITQGHYRIHYYLKAAENPHTDDLLLATRTIRWTGDEEAPPSSPEPIPVNDDALTTVEAVAAYLRLGPADQLDAASQNLLASLVNQVSARIERITARRFKARKYTFRNLRPALAGALTLPQYPIIAIDRMTTGRGPALKLRYESPTAIAAAASVRYDDQGTQGFITLTTVQDDGSTTTQNLAFDQYPALTSLAAAISNLDGWFASAIHNAQSCDLHPVEALAALNETATLTRPDLPLQWWHTSRETGTINLWLPARHVTITCTAGYESIPHDLQLITTQLVAQAFQQGRQNPAIKSESLGQYSYTLATTQQISDELWLTLRPYMEVR